MSATMNADLVWAHLLNQDYGKALELGLSAVRMKFSYPLTHVYLGHAYLCMGEYEKAVGEIEKVLPPGPFLAILGYAYGVGHKEEAARKTFRRMEDLSRRRYIASYDWAVLHSGLGETDAALRRLTQAVDEREPRVIWLKGEPVFQNFRDDKRFQDLIRRLQLG